MECRSNPKQVDSSKPSNPSETQVDTANIQDKQYKISVSMQVRENLLMFWSELEISRSSSADVNICNLGNQRNGSDICLL